jgi:sulfur-carrier protein adenylyltransferase/sulfurtransferase
MTSLTPAELARYSRHVMLPEVGTAGQERLRSARVLVIGAGGLGSPAALYLAAAGVGTLGIADFDHVERHNLQRQILHDETAVGRPKVDSAAERLQQVNPLIKVETHPDGITAENAIERFRAYDVIVDGTDNFGARYLNNDAAVLARRPLVYGSVFKFSGQVAVWAPHLGSACHRCLFPEPPPAGSVPGCGEAGVIGALCGVIGSLQALEALKVVLGLGEPLLGRLLTFDALQQSFSTLRVPRDPHCPACGHSPSISTLAAERYQPACEPPSAPMSASDHPLEISVSEAKALLDRQPDRARLIDVREPAELAICRIAGAQSIPMRQIPNHVQSLPRDQTLLILCHHGGRSQRVTEYLRAQGFCAAINVAGGIDAWAQEIEPGLTRY